MASTRLPDGRWQHTLHQSDLAEVDLCPERGRRRLTGTLPEVLSDSMLIGTAVHAACEYALREKQAGDEPSVMEVVGVFDLHLDDLVKDEFEFTKYANVPAMREVGQLQTQVWWRSVLPKITPRWIEQEQTERIYEDDERVVWIKGTPDCIDENRVTWDWKCSAAQYLQWEKQRSAIQPTTYTWLFRRDLGPPPWLFRYVLLRPKGTVEYCEVTRTESDHEWLQAKAMAVAQTLEAELPVWPVNDVGWHCSPKWCGAWSTCKGAFVDDDWAKVVR